ncbi:MAG: hypothetical protein LBJ08_04545 [Bifidobacteriaceae bacterium]|nr:hypothetical protein [Bifidobacteriaceae bacterium]
MNTITVTAEERRILKDYKRAAREILIQAKAEAILLAGENVDIEIIARFADREPSTVREWLRQWAKTCLASNEVLLKVTPEAQHEEAAQTSQIPEDSSTSLRARSVLTLLWVLSRRDLGELAAELAGDVAFEAAAGFAGGFAFRDAFGDVGLGFWVAGLAD